MTLETVILCVSIFLNTHMFHELGHLIAWPKNKKRPSLITQYHGGLNITAQIGQPTDYVGLSKRQKSTVYMAGILLGLIPIITATLINKLYAFLIIPYLTTCTKDIKNLIRQKNE